MTVRQAREGVDAGSQGCQVVEVGCLREEVGEEEVEEEEERRWGRPRRRF